MLNSSLKLDYYWEMRHIYKKGVAVSLNCHALLQTHEQISTFQLAVFSAYQPHSFLSIRFLNFVENLQM